MPDPFRRSPRRPAAKLLAVVGLVAALLSACDTEYDIVIAGGRVMDPESGLDAIRNVGILDGRVAAISEEPLSGGRVLDAAGLVVAPGFVDLHRHGQYEAAYRLQVHDGVTTGLELELGTPHVAEWYAEREGGQLVNYGVSVGHLGVRAVALGDAVTGTGGRSTRRAASPAQRAEIERLIRVGLAQGAVGIGVGAAYTPGAPMTELAEVLGTAAQRGVVAFIHTRHGLAGLDSTLSAARDVGASLHVVHANSSGGDAVVRFLDHIQAARDAGQDVTTEAYPYTASQALIQSAVFDGWTSWADDRFQRYEWVRTGERLTRESFAGYRAEGGSVIIHSRTRDLTLAAFSSPLTMVASDGGVGHPRGAGTFAKVLGRFVREQGALELMDALARMTIRPARRLEPFVPAMANKGRIRVGADADITIFDPETVVDRATYANGTLTSEGFVYVLVNGVVVLDGGELVEGVRPGRPVMGKPTY
jgi:dihydroorotase